MRSFKQRAAAAAVFILLFILANRALLFALKDDVQMRGNIERALNTPCLDLVIGTSQCRACVDPGTVSKITGRETLNCIIPLSAPLDQYFLIRFLIF